MIPFPTAELKQIELEVIQDCHAKIKTDEDKKRAYAPKNS